MNTQRVQVSSLHFDDKLVELRPINTVFVSRYRQAMRQGAKFPKMIVDDQDAIVCGNHRATAYLQEYGPDHLVDVEVRSYQEYKQKIHDFTVDNTSHGMPLNGITRRRITTELLKTGDTAEQIAQLFNVSVKRIEEWADHTVIVTGSGKKNEILPIKHGPEIEGEKVSRVQYAEHIDHDRGVLASQMAQQLTRWLKNGWIKPGDMKSIAALSELQEELGAFLVTVECEVTP